MAYATEEFYSEKYFGAIGGEAYLDKASLDIDLMLPYAINIDNLSETALDCLAMANCAQAEGYVLHGDPSQSTSGSVSLGSFSTSEGGAKQTGLLFDKASRYLSLAGFGYRGVPRVGR